ncbi:MAG: NAD(P)H-binding protein, partial [Polyangiaceae bacterium]|nr:NAD(P)H-binding protein [Polyangiaceae bacterium]
MRTAHAAPVLRPTVVVAGASGFIGEALAVALSPRFTVVGLSRRPRAARPGSGVSVWRPVDLVSRSEAEEALKGARFAVFLVHSFAPSAGLPVAGFADLDLLAADNFARAAASAGVEQIVFLSAISGAGRHQESRLEVERALGAHGVPVTTLRAGLIVGQGGSSFEITNRLVDRLPFMLLPAWTRTPSQPVALADVVRELADVVGRRECYRKAFEVGGAEIISYRTMLERT